MFNTLFYYFLPFSALFLLEEISFTQVECNLTSFLIILSYTAAIVNRVDIN